MKSTEITHPAYGVARFSRINGHSGNLFGSSVKCNNYIQLEIAPGVEFTEDSYHSFTDAGKEPLIRVAMSPAQFAELITTLNVGVGVPCTIERFNGEKVEKIPDEIHIHELDRQKEHFKEKMKEHTNNLKNAQKRVKELLALPRLNAEQKREIQRILDVEIANAESSIPFYMGEYNEATDKIVKEAKSEIDAAIHSYVTNVGIKALGGEFGGRQIEDHLTDDDRELMWKSCANKEQK